MGGRHEVRTIGSGFRVGAFGAPVASFRKAHSGPLTDLRRRRLVVERVELVI